MDNFCTPSVKAERRLRPEWESRLLEYPLLQTGPQVVSVERTQDDIDTANRQWHHALSLKEEQGEAEAVAYCRDCLAKELERWPRGSTNQSHAFLVRCCFVQLIRLWAADILENENEIEIRYCQDNVKRLRFTIRSWRLRMRVTDHEPLLTRTCTGKTPVRA